MQFLTKFILFCVTLDLSDNLTEMRIVKNWSVKQHSTCRDNLTHFVAEAGLWLRDLLLSVCDLFKRSETVMFTCDIHLIFGLVT